MPGALRFPATTLALCALLPSQSLTVSPLFRHGDSASGLGAAILGLGDINNDGYGDYAMGHSNDARRWVMAVSGRTGLQLWRTTQAAVPGFGASLVQVPDADNDGHADMLAGAPDAIGGAGLVMLLSARTGVVLAQMSVGNAGDLFGTSMCAVQDVNGDGRTDYLFGAPGYPGGAGWGRAVVVSGADYATVINDHQGFTPNRQLGAAVASADDLDNDGRGDYLVGEPYAGFEGQVRCYSGRFRILRYTLGRDGANGGFGYRLYRPGDLDGDGDQDLLVGSYNGGNGGLAAYDLRTGTFLYAVPSGGSIGSVLAPVGDLDGDGGADYAVYDPSAGWYNYLPGTVNILSGRTGVGFFLFGPPDNIQDTGLGFGSAISTGDIDGDGRTDMLVGQPGYTIQGNGRGVAAWSIALRKWPLTAKGHSLSISGGGRVSLDLDAGVANANRFYWFLTTTSGPRPGFDVLGQHIPLNPDPAMLLFLSNINSPFLPTQLGILDGSGRGGTFFQLIPGLGNDLIGITFDFAAVAFCAQFPVSMCIDLASNARPVTLVP